MMRWAAKSRRRHHVAGAILRTASPVLPRKAAPRDPVFIIGSPRSGTTMLLNMLDRSPALASLGMGSHFLWEMYHPFDPQQGHAVGPEAITVGERRTLNFTIDRICGGIRYLDKYPRMCLRVEYLHAMYPDAWFVYISRDGRAAASSMMTGWRTEGKFGAGTELPLPLQIEGYDGDVWKFLVPPGWQEYAQGHTLAEVCAFQWAAANAAVLDARERIASKRFVSVRYEQLVERPTETVGGLLDAIGLPHDGVLEWASQLDQRVSRTAVTPPRPDKWRDENPAAIESVLDRLAPTMARLGYELDAVAV
jgi:hypothetical protein